MNRTHPTSFAICVLLSLTTMSVTITVILLFYSSVYHIDSGFLRQVDQISTLPPLNFESVQFIDFDYREYPPQQKDERLWRFIAKHYLTKPSNKRYNFTAKIPTHPNQFSQLIYKMFRRRKGVFIEAGAFDGESASNSLYLEERGWQGILVECNPIVLPKLMSKNRRAWISNTCLSLTDKAEMLEFSTPVDWPASAKLGRPLNDKEMVNVGIDWMKNKTWLQYKVQCFPLYSIIKAVGEFKEIDFLSLDVEGSEIAVLEHFPFESIRIKVILVEVFSYPESEKKALQAFLSSKGYDLIETMENDQMYGLRGFNFNRH